MDSSAALGICPLQPPSDGGLSRNVTVDRDASAPDLPFGAATSRYSGAINRPTQIRSLCAPVCQAP